MQCGATRQETHHARQRMPEVAGCAVVGLPDTLWRERGRRAGFQASKRVFVQSDPLPITPTGKIREFLLVERHGDAPGGNFVDTER